jgi:hypothetical protein
MSEEVMALVKGVAAAFLLIGLGGICFESSTPLTYTLLGLSIAIFIALRHFGSTHE